MNPHDHIRFRRNPPNVSVPKGFADLYVDSSGNLVKETAGGVKEIVGRIPDEIEVNTLQLANQSEVVLQSGQIAVDENGRVIAGNGSKNVEVGKTSRFRVRNALHITAATITGGASYQTFGTIKLRADEWVAGQRAVIVGRFGGFASSAYAGAAYVGLRPSEATSDGFRDSSAFFGASGASAFLDFMAFVELKTAFPATTFLVIDEDESAQVACGIKTQDNATAADVISAASSSSSTANANASLQNTATDVTVYLRLPQDAGFTGYVRAFCDIEIILL